MLIQLFKRLPARLSYGFATAIFSVFGGQASAALGFLFVLLIANLPAERVRLHAAVLGCSIAAATLIHYTLFGMLWRLGRRLELPPLRRLNDWCSGESLDPDIPLEDLKAVTLGLERLPTLNMNLAALLSSLVVMLMTTLELLQGTPMSAARAFLGGTIAVVLYVIFAKSVTELTTRAMLGQARRLLSRRGAWTGPSYQAALNTKLMLFVSLIAISMVMIVSVFVLNPGVRGSPAIVLLFSGLLLGVAAFMSAVIFHAIIRPLEETEEAAMHLVTAQAAEFFSGSTHREFIALAQHFYAAAQQIVDYRRQLEELNRLLEQRVVERTAELEAQKEALRRSEQRLSLHVQQTPLAVIEWNLKFEVVKWNPSAERIFGYREKEAVGAHAVQLIMPAWARDRVMEVWHTLLESKEGLHHTGENLTKDGRVITCEWYHTALADHEGKVIGAASLALDITERKRTEELARQRSVELEARNADLDAFAHTVAHDLKNPLSALILLSGMLQDQAAKMPAQKLNENLERITQTGRTMTNIIDELLLLSSVRKMEDVRVTPLDMATIVTAAQNRLSDMTRKKQVEIITPAQWPEALGYAPWVEEMWVNYISNAAKYGGRPEEGLPPCIELGCDRTVRELEQEDGTEKLVPHVRFWVRDNGPGLTPDETIQLFTPFTRLNQVRAEGYGLGLSIVRRIAERLGGEVGVESSAGQGSLFYFTLPDASTSAG